ncbi:MAG: molecular chaperone HtpG [Betaproteobacteria bacterium]|nr:molecular chaperone HtpG [Betaproteobacteria bacterium]
MTNAATETVSQAQTHGFQAEVKQLLKLMIHSLYSNREIFLRELISNASDACDKLRFEAMSRPDLLGSDELAISIRHDAEARTITISDNGVGLSLDEAVSHLGTIAKSGTREFASQLSGDHSKDAQLIGQFGVGFYSAFIVAEEVTVESRRADLPAQAGVRWRSKGEGEFDVEAIQREARGTDVILKLRTDASESEGESFSDLLSGWKLRELVRKYSDHVQLPIRMSKEEWDKDAGKMVQKDELETINQASALWSRNKSEISDDQYKSFYKHIAHDFTDPLAWTHNRIEGRSEFTQLLYIPSRAPFDLWDRQQRHGLKLYIKRVFIMEDAEQLLPIWLRFMRGVIDSADLPLNVSREILQESRDVKAIREANIRRSLSLLEDLAENRSEDYASFWQSFGQVIKEGMSEESSHRDRLAKLLRFASTLSVQGADQEKAQNVALADYIKRMKPKQEAIYYATADTLEAARNSPHLEVFRKKEIEVLLLTDRVDEWMLSYLQEFDGKKLLSVASGLDDESEKEKVEASSKALKPLLDAIKDALADRVKEVRVTQRLTESPSCLVSEEGDISGHLERLLKQAGQKAPDRKPILEINPDHFLVKRLQTEQGAIKDWSLLLYEQALLAEGGQLADPGSFVKRLNDLLIALSMR